MNNNLKTAFDFNDFTIVPASISSINSRKEVDILKYEIFKDGNLPIMVAPMDTVIDKDNYYQFANLGLNICVPRGDKYYNSRYFQSISLDEFEEYLKSIKIWELNNSFSSEISNNKNFKYLSLCQYILIDIANGHMERLYEAVSNFYKDKIGLRFKQKLMIGNIANPNTYKMFAELGLDYARLGIGGGSACTTSANTGVHYPLASLIDECYEIKKENGFDCQLVADGGFKNFDDIIKALSLGADYVMLGSIFNKCLESCADTYFLGINITSFKEKFWKYKPFRKYMYKKYRGMSTKDVQKKWGREKLKTAEGISKFNKVEYSVGQWVENFSDYLKSAMSYTNSRNLDEFKNSTIVFITNNALWRFKK